MRPSRILKNSIQPINFWSLADYFGIAIAYSEATPVTAYADIERFFLHATLSLKNSRAAEGVLCWVEEYGHLLSPSKIRKFIKEGAAYDPAVLGAFLEFMRTHGVYSRPLGILDEYTSKLRKSKALFGGPRVRRPAAYFLKFNILAPDFALNKEKFLRPKPYIMKNCTELRHRSLFGSVLNSDVASALTKDPDLNAYAAAKITGHHKTNVFKNFLDIKMAFSI